MGAAMLLVVDVGNTQTHFGVYRDGEDVVAEHWRFATVRESTRDELGAALANLLGLRGLGFTDIDRSIVSSTVPQLSQEWMAMSGLYLNHEMLNVGPAIRTGMPIRIDNPREVGADRLVNAIAAYARFNRACIVVDFGTAITYFSRRSHCRRRAHCTRVVPSEATPNAGAGRVGERPCDHGLEAVANDEESLRTALTGEELGVNGASLYHHFQSKDEIVVGAAELALQYVRTPDTRHDDWPEWLARNTRNTRDALVQHPHLIPVVLGRAPWLRR